MDDLGELDDLRRQLTEDIEVTEHTEELFAQYYGNLCLIERRFPVTQYEGGVNACFVWADAFQPEQVLEMHKIGLEKAATLFNLAAYFSQMGINCDKETANDFSLAGKYFMKAASALHFVRLTVMPSLMRTANAIEPVDMSSICLEMLEGIMVGQAIECVFEKSVKSGAGHRPLAEIAQQLAVMYADTYAVLCEKAMKKHFERPWRYTFKIKGLYYEAAACLHQASHLKEKLGRDDIRSAIKSQIGYVQESASLIEEAMRLCSNVKYNALMKAEIESARKEICETLSDLQTENMSVSMVRVPPIEELEQIQTLSPQALPKIGALEYLEKPLASVRFNSIVPEEITRDWSKYTDMLDRMLRDQTDLIDRSSDDARVRLREMELPERLHCLEKGNAANVPDSIRVELESIEQSGGMENIRCTSQQVLDMNLAVTADLDDCRNMLRQLEARGASTELLQSYHRKIDGYKENLNVASKTDSYTRETIEKNREDFEGLTLAKAAFEAPVLESPMLLVDSTEPAEAVQALRLGLDGLEAIAHQRNSLEDELQKTKRSDDIVESLMAMPSGSRPNDIFQDHLAQYSTIRESIAKNIEKQKDILDAMGHANDVFTKSYDFVDWERKRRAMATRWKGRIEAYKNIIHSLQEGIEFYLTLSDAVGSMKHDLSSKLNNRNERGVSSPAQYQQPAQGDPSHQFSSLLHLGNQAVEEEEYTGVNPLFSRRK